MNSKNTQRTLVLIIALLVLFPTVQAYTVESHSNYHSLAVDEDGHAYAMGRNDYGQLGLGDTQRRNNWTRIPELENVRNVSAGAFHSTAITTDGDVYAWGLNTRGQVRPEGEKHYKTPQRITTAPPRATIHAFTDLIAIDDGQTIRLQGKDTAGVLNDTTTNYTLDKQHPRTPFHTALAKHHQAQQPQQTNNTTPEEQQNPPQNTLIAQLQQQIQSLLEQVTQLQQQLQQQEKAIQQLQNTSNNTTQQTQRITQTENGVVISLS